SKRFGGASISLKKLPLQEPRPGVFEGDDLTLRIRAWLRDRYGARLIDTDHPGFSVTKIKGDPYRISIPILAIALRSLNEIALSWTDEGDGSGTERDEHGRFIWRAGAFVEHLTKGTIGALRDDEKHAIAGDVQSAIECFRSIMRLYDGDYGTQ